MKLNRNAAEAIAQEQAAKRVVLDEGWYPCKVLEVEEKSGNKLSQGLVISARLKTKGLSWTDAEGDVHECPDTTKQQWYVNHTKKDGNPNNYGHATIGSLVEVAGAAVDDDDELEIDQLEAVTCEAFLTIQEASEGIKDGKPVKYARKNQVREFREYDAKAAKKASATQRKQAEQQAQVGQTLAGIDTSGPDPSDDIPF